MHGNVWAPKVVNGTGLADNPVQDSVKYRKEQGVFSLLIDDDGCDCHSSLSLGHGMCGTTFSTQYGVENSFGVDLLHDPGCHTPNNQNGLTLYFRGILVPILKLIENMIKSFQ